MDDIEDIYDTDNTYDTYYIDTSKQEEINFSCILKDNIKVQRFLIKILIKLIKKLLDYGESSKSIINSMVEKYKENTDDLIKPGLPRSVSIQVVNYVKEKKYSKIYTLLEGTNKYHRVMGATYEFMSKFRPGFQKFILYCIDTNKKLRKLVEGRIKKLLCLPDSISWKKIKELVGDLNSNMDIYLSMIVDVVKCPESNFRRNLAKASYIRSSAGDNIYTENPKVQDNCHKDITRNSKAKVVTANTWYNIDGTFFQNIMNYYNRPAIAGPSGSIILQNDLAFKLLNIKETRKNQLLILCCSIADYIPYYHTLTEILISYSHELNLKYTLDKDPVDFTTKLLKKYKIM